MGTGYLIKTERVVLSLSADVTWCDIGHLPLGYPLQSCSESKTEYMPPSSITQSVTKSPTAFSKPLGFS